MSQSSFEVSSSSGRCSISGRDLAQGEEFYTVLFEDGESFKRVDYSLESWSGEPEGAYCHFKSRIPVKEKKKQLLVNKEMLINFFERLAEDTLPIRIQFRFVIALILMRKRILRYDGSTTENEIETWQMTLTSKQSRHQVINPILTDAQIEDVSGQLSAIMHSDMGEFSSPLDDDHADDATAPLPQEPASPAEQDDTTNDDR